MAINVQFTDVSTVNVGSVVEAVWDFGDSSPTVTRTYPTDSKTFTHTYADPGTYTVTITVTGDLGATDNYQQILDLTVETPPVVYEPYIMGFEMNDRGEIFPPNQNPYEFNLAIGNKFGPVANIDGYRIDYKFQNNDNYLSPTFETVVGSTTVDPTNYISHNLAYPNGSAERLDTQLRVELVNTTTDVVVSYVEANIVRDNDTWQPTWDTDGPALLKYRVFDDIRPEVTILNNGSPEAFALEENEYKYFVIDVTSAGEPSLTFTITGGASGDFLAEVNFDNRATTVLSNINSWDEFTAPISPLEILTPNVGKYYLLVRAVNAVSGLSITAVYGSPPEP